MLSSSLSPFAKTVAAPPPPVLTLDLWKRNRRKHAVHAGSCNLVYTGRLFQPDVHSEGSLDM